MPKTAGYVMPSVEQFIDKVKRFSPAFFLTGAGAAGAIHMLQMRNEEQKTQQAQQPSSDVLTVTIPQKRAFVGGLIRWARANPGKASLGATGLGAAGYGASKDLLQPSGAAGPNFLADAGMSVLAAGGASALGYSIFDRILANRHKKQLEEQLGKAKNEYGSLLGQALSGPKVAALDKGFPILYGAACAVTDLQEGEAKVANPISTLTSFPSALAVIAGVMSHRWMYNRQKELAALHTSTKPSPPKEIRLVSAPPANNPALESPEAGDDFDEIEAKNAELGEWLQTLGLQPAPAAAEDPKSSLNDPKTKEVAPGTLAIETTSGPVTVEAYDPAAAAVLHKNTAKLRKLMAVLQVQPSQAAA